MRGKAPPGRRGSAVEAGRERRGSARMARRGLAVEARDGMSWTGLSRQSSRGASRLSGLGLAGQTRQGMVCLGCLGRQGVAVEARLGWQVQAWVGLARQSRPVWDGGNRQGGARLVQVGSAVESSLVAVGVARRDVARQTRHGAFGWEGKAGPGRRGTVGMAPLVGSRPVMVGEAVMARGGLSGRCGSGHVSHGLARAGWARMSGLG